MTQTNQLIFDAILIFIQISMNFYLNKNIY